MKSVIFLTLFSFRSLPGSIPVILLLLASLAGCAPNRNLLKQEMQKDGEIYVVYHGGKLITKFQQRNITSTEIPQSFQAISTIVVKGLSDSLQNTRVFEVNPGDKIRKSDQGMIVNVLVNGAYFCEGESPDYLCSLSMQTHLTFSTVNNGIILGKKFNLIGQTWYGNHPVQIIAGGGKEVSPSPIDLETDQKIKKEIPPNIVLEPLFDATEDGLTAFLDDIRSRDGEENSGNIP